ncbi:hypothetical protein GRI62_11175 [Erythrobacter arachoides]|uniref:Tetratricopeptide repeat protein n=1 Tax=Aurantiacibacter arachoides TaxID=1850444 RepID=A0A845A4S5_9SPHN|nr:tetratricopeptide repeat protein [Aurantiacibacter arachoides]MXO94156.1 hypothetical protein [Aurantiacibacter arachoides]GGD65615.1 hypothetical protein GCM10011411_27510 [Aurantiacibacter arachoides]
MLATLALAPLLFAQAVTSVMVEQQYEQRDVAFAELAAGDAPAAIAALEAELAQHPDDPALLINLGSAWSRAGNAERAEFYYRAARDTDQRYNLELADGRWIDSRDAAQLALASVELRALAAR